LTGHESLVNRLEICSWSLEAYRWPDRHRFLLADFDAQIIKQWLGL